MITKRLTFPCQTTQQKLSNNSNIKHQENPNMHHTNILTCNTEQPFNTSSWKIPPPFNATGITLLQQIIGTFFYYARAINITMLVALGTLGAAQAKGTKATAEASTKLLNYAATHPYVTIQFKASNMVLHVHSNASYLSETKAQS
jgi:hypothetical protein